MKFNGASGIQVRTPSNLADLAAYTSLKFYITLPEAARTRRQGDGNKQFVFYLGNKDVSISCFCSDCFPRRPRPEVVGDKGAGRLCVALTVWLWDL